MDIRWLLLIIPMESIHQEATKFIGRPSEDYIRFFTKLLTGSESWNSLFHQTQEFEHQVFHRSRAQTRFELSTGRLYQSDFRPKEFYELDKRLKRTLQQSFGRNGTNYLITVFENEIGTLFQNMAAEIKRILECQSSRTQTACS